MTYSQNMQIVCRSFHSHILRNSLILKRRSFGRERLQLSHTISHNEAANPKNTKKRHLRIKIQPDG